MLQQLLACGQQHRATEDYQSSVAFELLNDYTVTAAMTYRAEELLSNTQLKCAETDTGYAARSTRRDGEKRLPKEISMVDWIGFVIFLSRARSL
jgi:hypothetical protein